MRPKIRQFNSALGTSTFTQTRQRGPIVTLHWEEIPYLNQQYSSKKRNCIEGNVYTYNGILTLDPFVDTTVDNTIGPVVTTPEVNRYSSIVNGGRGAITTLYNNWQGKQNQPKPTWLTN